MLLNFVSHCEYMFYVRERVAGGQFSDDLPTFTKTAEIINELNLVAMRILEIQRFQRLYFAMQCMIAFLVVLSVSRFVCNINKVSFKWFLSLSLGLFSVNKVKWMSINMKYTHKSIWMWWRLHKILFFIVFTRFYLLSFYYLPFICFHLFDQTCWDWEIKENENIFENIKYK